MDNDFENIYSDLEPWFFGKEYEFLYPELMGDLRSPVRPRRSILVPGPPAADDNQNQQGGAAQENQPDQRHTHVQADEQQRGRQNSPVNQAGVNTEVELVAAPEDGGVQKDQRIEPVLDQPGEDHLEENPHVNQPAGADIVEVPVAAAPGDGELQGDQPGYQIQEENHPMHHPGRADDVDLGAAVAAAGDEALGDPPLNQLGADATVEDAEDKGGLPETNPTPPSGRARARRDGNNDNSDDHPDWLPEGWNYDKKVRRRGKSAGHEDKYYINPQGQKFRSRSEVERYLELMKQISPN